MTKLNVYKCTSDKFGKVRTTYQIIEGEYRGQPIAEMSDSHSEEEQKRYAQLFAAAPKMFEALENLVDNYNSKDGDMNLLRHFIKEGEKAIAKAEGK